MKIPDASRIVFLTPHLKSGGGNRVFIELANELARAGNAVDIVFPRNSDKKSFLDIDKRISISGIGSYRGNKIIKIVNLLRLLIFVRNHRRYAKIIASDPIMCIFLFLLRGRSVYRFIQGDDYGLFDDRFLIKNRLILYIFKFLTRISFRYKIQYIFNSRFSYSAFTKYSGRCDVACRIVYPAINHLVFYNRQARPDNLINLCLVGRRHPLKGLEDFLEVWHNNKEWLTDKIAKVYIISDDELSRFDLSDFEVIVPKNDSHMADIYNKAHIFIFPSWKEGFGLPALEAMACGCAVILSDCGGVNEYAISGENCLTYEPHDRAQLECALKEMVNSSLLIKKLSTNAQTTARNFSWEKSAVELRSIIGV